MYLNLDNGVAKTGGKCYNIFIECGRGSMVERDLAKVKTRVRFPSPAPVSSAERRFFYAFLEKYRPASNSMYVGRKSIIWLITSGGVSSADIVRSTTMT